MYSLLQKLKTGHDFQAFLCWDMRLFNFMFLLHHPVWVEEDYKEGKRMFYGACERKQYENKHN